MVAKLKRLEVPFTEDRLGNGLRVIVQHDQTAPIVAVHMMYHVGSRDERVGRTGLAHLLEHLLFEGSENCPKGEFDRLLEKVGGSNNGSTWLDRTNYFEVVPSHAVELALWLERERMTHFLPVLDEEMLEIQRSVVINERKQVYENRPYGLAHEKLFEILFAEGHPYSWPTIGYTADLEAMTLDDARNFYRNFYAPHNAVLVLAGDLTIEQGFRWAERYFGDIGEPHRAASPNGKRDLPVRPSGRSMTLQDRVSFPRVYHAFTVPGYGTREWIALDVLTYLLADGESSRLQRHMLRDLEIAQDADTYLYPTQMAGVFGIVATARSGVSAETLVREIDEVMDRVVNDGVTDAEVAGAIRRARRDHLNAVGNVEDRAEELAYAATVLGTPARLAEVLNGYGEVTASEIRDLAGQYLGRDRRATVIVVPGAEGEGDE